MKKRTERRKRNEAIKEPRTRWLFMSQGKETELNYFRGLLQHLKDNGGLGIGFKSAGEGKDPMTMVGVYENRRRDRLVPYENVVFIFDKDDTSDKDFNNAIVEAKKHGIVSWSNECFELWLCLHFEDVSKELLRAECFAKLSKILGKDYKTDPDIFRSILEKGGCYKKATIRAEKLAQSKSLHNPAKSNPCTMIFEAIIELEKEAKP